MIYTVCYIPRFLEMTRSHRASATPTNVRIPYTHFSFCWLCTHHMSFAHSKCVCVCVYVRSGAFITHARSSERSSNLGPHKFYAVHAPTRARPRLFQQCDQSHQHITVIGIENTGPRGLRLHRLVDHNCAPERLLRPFLPVACAHENHILPRIEPHPLDEGHFRLSAPEREQKCQRHRDRAE